MAFYKVSAHEKELHFCLVGYNGVLDTYVVYVTTRHQLHKAGDVKNKPLVLKGVEPREIIRLETLEEILEPYGFIPFEIKQRLAQERTARQSADISRKSFYV